MRAIIHRIAGKAGIGDLVSNRTFVRPVWKGVDPIGASAEHVNMVLLIAILTVWAFGLAATTSLCLAAQLGDRAPAPSERDPFSGIVPALALEPVAS
jgi:hypothetical protein